MPELPEVETLRRGLAARLTGMRITALEILDHKISGGPGDAIKHAIDGHEIGRVARRGKVLILFLREPGSGAGETGSLLIHPKMTGQLVLTSDGATVFAGGHPTPSMLRPMPNVTTRAVFQLGPACCLYYNDARRFGWIRPAGPDPCRTDPFLRRLGPDPLGGNFTPAGAGYVNEAHGRPGYLGQAHVFRRQGLPCDVCGTPIIRTTVAGRATNYCPHCQQHTKN